MVTPAELGEDYIESVKDRITDLPDAEKITLLLDRVKYWYESAFV